MAFILDTNEGRIVTKTNPKPIQNESKNKDEMDDKKCQSDLNYESSRSLNIK